MEWKPKRHRTPPGFADAIDKGFDYDHSNTEAENRQRARDDGYFETELISDEAFDAWREEGEKLSFHASAHQWTLGDWIVQGEELKEIAGITRNQEFKHGVYSVAADITGLSVATIKDYAYVARNVPDDGRRNAKLGFGHHKLIAGLPEKLQLEFLSEMELGHLAVGAARRRIRFVLNQGQPRHKPNDKNDLQAERIIRLGEELIEALSHDHLTAKTPSVYFRLMDTVTKALEVLDEKISAASVRTDADAA
jgi:hypothetical protein